MALTKIANRLQRLSISIEFTPFSWTANLELVPSIGWFYIDLGPLSLEINW